MITKLTKEQETQIPKYIEKWVKKASEPVNHERAIEYTEEIYKDMGKEKPLVIFGSSPFNTALLCSLFFSLVKDKEKFEKLYSQLGSQLGSQLDSQLHSQLYSQLDSQLKDINQNWYLGLWWLVWCGWYDYANYIGVKFDKKNYDLFIGFNSEVHFIIPYNGIAFISEKPVEIKWKNGRLHNENGMAIRYPDNYGLWCLNGVKVPDWLVIKKAEEIDPKLVLEETNADVQREIIRKIGAERLLKHCNAKTLDNWDDPNTNYNYKLMDMNIGDRIRRKYLYFEHASMKGVFYAKPIPPEVNTALQGRAWILSMIEREDIKNLTKDKEAELIANLPSFVS